MGGDWYAPHLIYGLRINYSTAHALLCERNRRKGSEESFVASDGEPYDYSEDVLEEEDAYGYCEALGEIARDICPDLPDDCQVHAVTDDKCTRKPSFEDLAPDFVLGVEIEYASPLCIADIAQTEDRLREMLTRLKALLPTAAPLHSMKLHRFGIGAHICMVH